MTMHTSALARDRLLGVNSSLAGFKLIGMNSGLMGLETLGFKLAAPALPAAASAVSLMGMETLGAATGEASIGDKLDLKLEENIGEVGLELGRGRILPDIAIKTGYNDNLTLESDNTIGAFYTTVAPHGVYTISDKTRKFIIDTLIEAAYFEGSTEDNYIDNRLRASFEYDPTSRLFANVFAEFMDSHDGRGKGRATAGGGVTQASLDEWHQWGLGGKFAYGAESARGRLEYEPSYLNKVYDTNRFITFSRDKEELTNSARFFYRIRPKTSLVFEGRTTDHDYKRDAIGSPTLDGGTHTLLAGVTWRATYKTTGFAKFGYVFKTFDSDLRSNTSDPGWQVGLDWKPRSFSKVHFETDHTIAETDGTGDAINQTNLLLFWEHYWRERFQTRMDLGYQSSTYDTVDREDTAYLAGVSATYNFRRWLTLGASYRYQTLQSTDNVFDYDQNVFQISLDLVF